MATQQQYSVLNEGVRKLYISIDLLNEDDVVIDTMSGIATDGNVSLSGNSSNRRSGSLTMVLAGNHNLLPAPDSKLWFDKRCAIHVGLKNYNDEIIYFKLGRFAIDEVEVSVDLDQRTISCQLKDYMSFLDGTLGGRLHNPIRILAESASVSTAIRETVAGLPKIVIEEIKNEGSTLMIPYTIERQPNSTVYEVLKELVDLYMGMDMYFDADGYFIVEKIREARNDSVVARFDGQERNFLLNASSKLDFKNVHNSVHVWGRVGDDGSVIKWVYRNRWARKKLSERAALTGKEKGDICHIIDLDNSYVWNGSAWELLDFKVVSQFNIESIGEKVWSVSEDKYVTETQARLKCKYDLINYSHFAEQLSFSCVPLYHLGINNKIAVAINDDINGDYLIDSISIPLDISSSMSIQCHKIYY